jgi:signal peptidase I
MSYHFRKPNRGEVFVFTTGGIRGISTPATYGSQHYIKRLGGVPGDQIDIEEPYLNHNGKRAVEPGFLKVMSREGGYTGYTNEGTNRHILLKDEEYFALGDNSASSSDSRMWGTVPEQNLVGRALVAYWPFSGHWGVIR